MKGCQFLVKIRISSSFVLQRWSKLPCELPFGSHQGAFTFDLLLVFAFRPWAAKFESYGGPSFQADTFTASHQGHL